MRFLIFAILAFLTLPAVAQQVVKVNASTAIYSGADTTSAVVATLPAGTEVMIMKAEGKQPGTSIGWASVRRGSNKGYTPMHFLVSFGSPTPTAGATAGVWPVDSLTGLYSFKQVVKAEHVSKAELYTRGREWFARTFRSADQVLEMEDREAGKLIGKAYSPFRNGADCWYTVIVQVKDGKYKVEITNIYYKAKGSTTYTTVSITAEKQFSGQAFKSDGTMRPAYQQYKEETEKVVYALQQGIKAAMSRAVAQNDDF